MFAIDAGRSCFEGWRMSQGSRSALRPILPQGGI
jgi:hypothetical protein